MALVSSNGRVDHRWAVKHIADQFPTLSLWMNFHPEQGEYRLHFGRLREQGTDQFIASSFPVDPHTEDWVELAITKLMLVV